MCQYYPNGQLATAVDLKWAKNSGKKYPYLVPGIQNKIGSHDVFYKDPDCAAPLPWQKKRLLCLPQISRRAQPPVVPSSQQRVFRGLVYFEELWYLHSELARQSTWILSGGEEINEDECFRGLEDTLSIRKASQALKREEEKIGVA
jgi:hypothetical protein